MNQADLVARVADKLPSFAWFLGAGASRSAGLPTAADIIWDLKRRQYCREENQEITRQDIQNYAIKERLQSYFDSHGYPPSGSDQEYTGYFERIFGADKERQRAYIRGVLGEDRVSLSVGNRVLGALMADGLARIAFTTNFDTVLEKAVAEMGRTLSSFHLEGAGAANVALNNDDFPLYCKLHGDFRYDSLKNLSSDLRHQNDELSKCLLNSGTRFGLVVVGYSGRDESVMQLFHEVLKTPNPFPHGLYWTVMKGSKTPPSVRRLLDHATERGIEAYAIETQTFDAFMLHLWRNVEAKSKELDAKVRKLAPSTVDIPMPSRGKRKPLLRLTALPILSQPERCLSLSFRCQKTSEDLRQAVANSNGALILANPASVCAWGLRADARRIFGSDLVSLTEARLPTTLRRNSHIKGLFEHAISKSLARDRPLLVFTRRHGAYVIADNRPPAQTGLAPIADVVGTTSGLVPGLSTSPTLQFPNSEPVRWAEALRVKVDERNGQLWLLIHPDLWIWPPRARPDAREFMARRRRDRFNRKFNTLLDAWLKLTLGPYQPAADVEVSSFSAGDASENPRFVLGSRTAFARSLS